MRQLFVVFVASMMMVAGCGEPSSDTPFTAPASTAPATTAPVTTAPATTAPATTAPVTTVVPASPGASLDPTTTLLDESVRDSMMGFMQQYEGRLLSVGGIPGAFEVIVAANEEALAIELDARPDVTVVGVGGLAWPITDAVATCRAIPADPSPIPIEGLVIEVVVPTEPLDAGGASLSVRFTNASDGPINFDTGIAVAAIVDGNGNVVNANTSSIPAIELNVGIHPGESDEIALVVDTASCDPALGYVVPSGDYTLVARFGLTTPWSTPDRSRSRWPAEFPRTGSSQQIQSGCSGRGGTAPSRQ